MRHPLLARAFAATAALVSLVAAAQPYPDKTVTIISPYGAGGNADLAARSLAAVAPKYLGQSIVVMDRTGAGGTIGSKYVLDSNKDGYTLLLARVGSQAVAPALDPTTPYKWNSFTFLGMLELDPYVCVVSSKSPLHSFADLVSALKAHPGKLNYASTGNLDASVVFPVKIFLNLGLSKDAAVKIPYKGAGETVAAVLSGQVDFACNGLSPYAGQLKAGRMRALVVSTPHRVAAAPDAPTAKEVGMPNLGVVTGWSALYGPTNLPRAVVDKWVKVLARVKRDPNWIDQVRKRGSIPTIMSPAGTRTYVEQQYNAYRALSALMAPK